MTNLPPTSTAHDGDLEARLAGMTRWQGEAPKLWQAALHSERPHEAADRTAPKGIRGVLTRRRRFPALAAVIVLALIGVTALMLPSLGTVRSSRHPVAPSEEMLGRTILRAPVVSVGTIKSLKTKIDPDGLGEIGDSSGSLPPLYSIALHEPSESQPPESPRRQSPGSLTAVTNEQAGERHVVRKASVDLSTPDVRATFAKLAIIPFEALGEFVETSSLTGEGRSAGANMTLRVAATRLSEVLNEIRTLGTVTSETSGGQDVTDRVVDLEARLRNEQRVEAELLELLHARKDAPLKEILELRDSISRIREQIEQMTAQREQLGRLVSLATVLVVIRPSDAPPAAQTSGMGDYFFKSVTSAWDTGLHALADSFAWVIRVAVGGLMVWLFMAAAVLGLIVIRRRWIAAAAREAAPTH